MDLQHKPIQERRLFARLGHLISVALGLVSSFQERELGALQRSVAIVITPMLLVAQPKGRLVLEYSRVLHLVGTGISSSGGLDCTIQGERMDTSAVLVFFDRRRSLVRFMLLLGLCLFPPFARAETGTSRELKAQVSFVNYQTEPYSFFELALFSTAQGEYESELEIGTFEGDRKLKKRCTEIYSGEEGNEIVSELKWLSELSGVEDGPSWGNTDSYKFYFPPKGSIRFSSTMSNEYPGIREFKSRLKTTWLGGLLEAHHFNIAR